MAARGHAYFAFAGAARRPQVSRLYPRFVRTAKVALPAAAAALLLAVFAWPEADESPGPQSPYGAAQVAMVDVNAVGWDGDRSVSVQSARSQRIGNEGQRFRMERPTAEMELPDGGWLSGSSDSGIVDWEERTVRLSGSVRLHHDAGYAIRTQAAFVDLAGRTAAGDAPVEGEGESSRFRAEGFRVLDGGNRIRLVGNSAVRFDSAPAVLRP